MHLQKVRGLKSILELAGHMIILIEYFEKVNIINNQDRVYSISQWNIETTLIELRNTMAYFEETDELFLKSNIEMLSI